MLLLLTCKFSDFIHIHSQVNQNADELKNQQEEMHRRVNLSNENGSRDEFKDKVTEPLHEPNIRQQISHEAKILWLIHLVLKETKGLKI